MDYGVHYLGERPELINCLADLWLSDEASCRTPGLFELKKAKYSSRLNVGKIPFVMLAHVGEVIVGTAGLAEHDLIKRPDLSPWLVSVFVRPDRRHSGIAKDLVGRVIKQAKHLGYDRIYLHTEEAQDFYEKLGWNFFEHTVNDYNNTSDIYYLDI